MPLYLRIDVKKGCETRPKLLLDLVFAALESVHGDMRISAILEFNSRRTHFRDLTRGQETEAVH